MKKAKTDLLVKSNELIKASYVLSVIEHRLVGLAICDAREQEKGLREFEHLVIKPSRYADMYGVTMDAAYKALKEAADSLFERQVTFMDSYKGIARKRKTRWVSEIAYLENHAELYLIFAPAIVDEITRLEEQFTEYLLKLTANFESQYSYRLFDLIKQWNLDKVKEIPVFEIDRLRLQFGLSETEYARIDNFKRKILDKAISEINKHTDIIIDYTQIKSGRVVTGFKFEVKRKPSKLTVKDAMVEKNTPIVTSIIGSSKAGWQVKGLSDKQIDKIKIYEQEFVDANVSKLSTNDRRSYSEIFESWRVLLKNPVTVGTFHKVQEILERQAIS